MAKTPMNFRFEAGALESLRTYAKAEGRSLNNALERLVELGLKDAGFWEDDKPAHGFDPQDIPALGDS